MDFDKRFWSNFAHMTRAGAFMPSKFIEKRGRGGCLLNPIQIPNRMGTYKHKKEKARQHRKDVKKQKRHMRMLKEGNYVSRNQNKRSIIEFIKSLKRNEK